MPRFRSPFSGSIGGPYTEFSISFDLHLLPILLLHHRSSVQVEIFSLEGDVDR